ncbi:MAG: TonB-dependent receptor [Thermoanaerobaculia bacterium]|nr:TonB-dependent receptor [Thermoanaerobaculia bacterium]
MGTKRILWSGALLILCAAMCAAPALAQSGGIDGKVQREDGSGIGGVTVVVSETGQVEITNNDGIFRFAGVPAGTYNVSISLGDEADSRQVDVTAGQTTEADFSVDWDISFAETITVFSASRRVERVVDAPASVTLVTEQDIDRQASTGQLAKVLEFAPGVEVTQSGTHDFNLNTRGFNSSLNRRVQVLVDGRNPQVPFLGSTEWAYLGNMEGLESVELVRGPSSALYGANAFNGVLNMVTKSPRNSLGGSVTLAGGDLSTLRADAAFSFELGSGWYAKLNGSYTEGDSWYQERVTQREYDGLPQEAAIGDEAYDFANLVGRVDKYLRDEKDVLTLEIGEFDGYGGVIVTGIGRVNILDADRSHLRLNYNNRNFNFLAYQNERYTPDQLALASGNGIFLDTEQRHAELQGNGSLNDGKIRLVGGISYSEAEIDTRNFQGVQTLVFESVDSDSRAAFGQVDFDLGDSFKLVLAGRYDESSLHDDEFSPKSAIVWSIGDNQTLRASYNEAFQVGNYSEFFLDAPTALPGPAGPIPAIDLSGIEAAFCTPLGISCGFGSPTQVRALGNANLEVEEVEAWEIGYSGIFGNKAYLTVDYYQNNLSNFISDLLPNPQGRINPAFGSYQAPAGHPEEAKLIDALQNALGTVYEFLSNNVDGTPIFALASYTNAGEVDTEGIDVGLNYYATPEWLVEFSYSWFDFDLVDLGGLTDPIFPNAPENKAAFGVTYTGERWGFSAKYRWTDDFFWAAGVFEGPVDSYSIVDLTGNFEINENISVGINVSNVFDDEHYQSFGGDILGRRALGTVKFTF